jgi:hypothetical protein
MSLLSYLGSKLAPIYMVLAGSLVSICAVLESSSPLKAPNARGITGLHDAVDNQRLSSLSLTVATAAVASSRLFCS